MFIIQSEPEELVEVFRRPLREEEVNIIIETPEENLSKLLERDVERYSRLVDIID
jgi:hypothetical protein|tara:strand:+ start:10438 stop:10602 length:165 start_codon:yes stop_codon:yes gene_type:complete